MLGLWSFRYTVFVEKVLLKWALSSAITYAAIILCCLATILFNIHRPLSVNFEFHSLFLLADDGLSCFVYTVITLDAAAHVSLNSSAVFVTDAFANGAPTICSLSK
jgi:hypothetical protein